MSDRAREVAVGLVRSLREAGHEAYFAGGCVRDELLGLDPQDYDVATDATPERVEALFPGGREVGRSFGVMLVTRHKVTVEVTTFRREGVYTDRRRPDRVEFTDARTDAARRDFTINAMFIDPLAPPSVPAGATARGTVRGKVIDFVGGLDDLARGVIRAVGDADARLAEDNLRALRAVRFAARLAFEIEPATASAIERHAAELAGVSRERVGDELRRMMTHSAAGARARAAALLAALGLDGPALGEAGLGRTGAAKASSGVLASLGPGAPLAAALGAWAIDRLSATAPGAVLTIDRLAQEGPGLVARWRRALCLSNDESEELSAVLRGVVTLERDWGTLREAHRRRAAASGWFPGALALVSGRDHALAHRLGQEVTVLAARPGGLTPPALVSGDDLIAAGLVPGPSFGKWLDGVYDEQLEGQIASLADGLAWVRGRASAGNRQGGSDDQAPGAAESGR